MNIFSLLAVADTSAITSTADKVATESFNAFYGIVNVVLPVVIAFLLVIGAFYGIQLGVKYAKAEDDGAKKAAKDQLINVVVGIVIAVVFVAIVWIVLTSGYIRNLFVNTKTVSL